MNDETPAGSGRAVDGEGPSSGGAGEQSPLQARAAFLKNWSWELIISLNQGACERGGAQHGFNREAEAQVQKKWEASRGKTLSFGEVVDFLRWCHRSAPFLFFNGNTFADVGRQLTSALFAELPVSRRREASSAIAHNIAGVLDRETMAAIVEGLFAAANFEAGDRVKTFRGSTRGVVIRPLPDGRVVWKADGSGGELIALPESLLKEN